jgi:hypothetical protein
MDCQSNGYPSEKDHDLPGIQTRDLQISSQHCLTLHHLGRPFSSEVGKIALNKYKINNLYSKTQ